MILSIRRIMKEGLEIFCSEKIKSLYDINNNYIVLATKRGIIKKTSLEAYSRPRANGVNAITVREGDELLEASRGLLVNIVREDSYGWCTVFTSNKRVGLMHKSNLKPLSEEEEKELEHMNLESILPKHEK